MNSLTERVSRPLLRALLGGAALGCNEPPPTSLNCPDGQCISGLNLTFDSRPPDGTVITVATVGESRQVTCGDDFDCSGEIIFEDFMPEAVVVRVTNSLGETSLAAAPNYQPRYPHGTHCDPSCHRADLAVQLPTGSDD